MNRLTSSEEFAAVRKAGIYVRTSALRLAARPSDKRKLGIITSRKVGTAVQRNRIRRVVREHFRLYPKKYPQADCVIIAFSSASSVDNKTLRIELEQGLIKLHSKLA